MRMVIDLDIGSTDRAAIEDRMSTAMGRFVEGLNSTDFATWTPETWQQFIACGFDVCATEVFSKRVNVAGPWHTDAAPY
jgi:hypothetical protein